MIGTMTQDTKDRIRELEGQKVILEDRLEHLGYASNLVKMLSVDEGNGRMDGTSRILLRIGSTFDS